ncbi:MAG: hypothetical protein LCH59_00575 [Proteobacteria bacterium]|nr:hypothetical protein [Pseudomonadota bacterium]
MGKNSKPVIGYWHFMGLYTGECAGPADVLFTVEAGGEIAWQGEQWGSGSITIDKPNLFGGEKKEGGIVGTLNVRMGESTQLPDPYLQAQVPGPWPAARGLVTTVFDGIVGAMNPYVKLWSKCWGRWFAGWKVSVWEPDLCKVGEGMNAAHIFYDALTDTDAGGGFDPSQIDTAGLLPVAQQLYDEGFGLCLAWSRSTSLRAFIATLCDHVGGQWYEDPRTGKFGLALFRGGYDVDELPVLDGSNILGVDSWVTPQLDGSINEITVVGLDCFTNKEISVTYQNLANIQAQGRVISDKRQMPGLWNKDLLHRVAARECLAVSSLPQRMKLRVSRDLWGIKRGDVRALTWAPRGVAKLAVRVEEVDEGTATDSVISLTLIEDVNGMAQASYVAPGESAWVPPPTAPVPVPHQRLLESSYRDLAGYLSTADLQALASTSGYLIALGARASGVAFGIDLATRTGATDFQVRGSGEFCPTGTLSGLLTRGGDSFIVEDGVGLDEVAVGDAVLIDDEQLRITSIDVGTGEVGVARGCVDTVDVEHAAGSRVWFLDAGFAADPTEYLQGEEVDAKLLTRTSRGSLDPDDAATLTLEIQARQALPYPPGKIRLNGAAEPASISGVLTVTWAHRDRLLQADQVIDTEQDSIGPELSTRYAMRFLDASDDVLVERQDVDGATADVALNYTGTVTMEIYSITDNGASLQRHRRVFDYTPPPGITESSIDAPTWTPTVTVIDGNDP